MIIQQPVQAANAAPPDSAPVYWYYAGDEKVALPLATDALIVV